MAVDVTPLAPDLAQRNVINSRFERRMAVSFFLRWLGPGFVNGISLGLWLKLLAQNRFAVGSPYLCRAAVITMGATLNSVGGVAERLLYREAIERAVVHPPVFVLGAWRSGTTHLHNLLSKDDRFAFPNTFQAMNPHIFLSTESWLAPFEQMFFPATRPFDNIRMSVHEPMEDEFAIMGMCGLSPFGSWVFPEHHDQYDKYVDFKDASQEDRLRWQETVLYFLKKLSLKYDKPLVLKSPHHTARIRLLLELSPEAKFVHVHRHPYQVYVSSRHLMRRALPMGTVQRFDLEAFLERAIPAYRLHLDAYFEQRHLIPPGNLIEVRFDRLEESPISTLRQVYEGLGLPPFGRAEPAVREYVKSVAGYRRNTYAEIDSKTKATLAREWSRSFKELGYAT